MADKKKYLDLAGLEHYDEKIKELIKSGDGNLETEIQNIINSYVTKTDLESQLNWGTLGASQE